MLEPQYNAKNTEETIYAQWEESGYFNPDKLPNASERTKNYIVYMPLPNVTGTLHMGHALDNGIQDILIRYNRMRGYKTLWFPGTDHAGISAQYVVEKELKKEGSSRFELGREKFLERVWQWKTKYGDIILSQLRKLGVSADWSRTRFTMDLGYSADVLKTFVHYYEKGLLYRGLRTVNWCPQCGTTLSELELEYEDEKTKLYYIAYGPFTLATTRPETKFGDTALAVNPKDARYKSYVGKTLEVDSLDTSGPLDAPKLKKIKLLVVADEAVDPKFGTGVVKVTPAHDITDFEIGERHKLPMIQIIDERGRMNEHAGKYAGMKAAEARTKIVEDLKAVGLLTKEEEYAHRVAKCYRSNTVIEPIPSAQWFLKMDALAKMALQAVKSKSVTISPKKYEKTYTDWLKNIRDWAVSRQIWWGHRLPVWFCKNQKDKKDFIVSVEKPKICPFCKQCEMEQASDVLDTWFSSALWPFAGLSESDLKNYYPGSALITARDILNLWVARMIFSGLEFRNAVPFQNVFIHGTILTKEGRRMSKSLGTGIDPLKYIDMYGADATRFGVIWQASGQDIRWDENAIVAGKKFTNKIWNAARFVLGKLEGKIPAIPTTAPNRKLTAADKAILKELAATKKQIEKHLAAFAFSKAIRDLYDFFWHKFCDVYLEKAKIQLDDQKLSEETCRVLLFTLHESLKLLHPFMPFVTEAVYSHLPGTKGKLLIVAPW